MRADLFDCLPAPTALLLLSSILELTSAHVLQPLPRQTQVATVTVPYHTLNVISWPLRPTPAPHDLFALRRRQQSTICGYIGGDPALPATCSAGSHCALDTENNVVGCCPDGDTACTAGVFTGCVDANSGPQTEVNPYVFSCTGGDVCYQNVFEGGFSQFGCGTASDLATVVAATASGITSALARPTVTVSYSQGISTLSEPTTLGTIPSTSTTTSSTTSSSPSSSSSSSSSSPSGTADPASTPSASAAPSTTSRTGAIVGGTIGGLAVLIALIALAFFFLRRRNANTRQGPGVGGIRSKSISPPEGGTGTGFVALAQDAEAFETGPGPLTATTLHPNPMTMANNTTGITTGSLPPMPFQNDLSPGEDPTSPFAAYAGAGTAASGVTSTSYSSHYPPNSASSDGAGAGYQYPTYQYPAAYGGGTGVAPSPVVMTVRGHERQLEPDRVPLTREIDDFSHGFSAALGRIGEEGEEEVGELGADAGGIAGGGEAGASAAAAGLRSPPRSAGSSPTRPLWQQNRRQSRNLMWM